MGPSSLEEVAAAFASLVQSYTSSLNWNAFLYNAAIAGGLFLTVLILYPGLIGLLRSAFSSLVVDVCTLQLKLKGGGAGDNI